MQVQFSGPESLLSVGGVPPPYRPLPCWSMSCESQEEEEELEKSSLTSWPLSRLGARSVAVKPSAPSRPRPLCYFSSLVTVLHPRGSLMAASGSQGWVLTAPRWKASDAALRPACVSHTGPGLHENPRRSSTLRVMPSHVQPVCIPELASVAKGVHPRGCLGRVTVPTSARLFGKTGERGTPHRKALGPGIEPATSLHLLVLKKKKNPNPI